METQYKERSIDECVKEIDRVYYANSYRKLTMPVIDKKDASELFATITDDIDWMAEQLDKYIPRKYEATFGAQRHNLIVYAVNKFADLVSFSISNAQLAAIIKSGIPEITGTSVDFLYFKRAITWCIIDRGYSIKENRRYGGS